MNERPLTAEQERELLQDLDDQAGQVDRDQAARDRARERGDDPLLRWPARAPDDHLEPIA